jgi:hypothetical protein
MLNTTHGCANTHASKQRRKTRKPDREKRVAYCRWLQAFLNEDPGILDFVWFTDEALFHLSGYVNSQNTRVWAAENPHEEPLHPLKVRVWGAISRRRIIAPIFFEETVNTFNTFVNQLDDEELLRSLFQQDGVTCHMSNDSTAEIESDFEDRIVSKGLWPPRSPDLTLPDFILWGILKGRVSGNRPRTLQALRNNIESEIQAITQESLHRTFRNMARRVQACLEAQGGHLQHLL